MSYQSKAQERFFNYNRSKLEKQGVNVDEWNQASKGKDLPERVGKKPTFKQKMRKAFPGK